MRKIALILRTGQSNWVSCRSITSNLMRAYELAFPAATIMRFQIEDKASKYEVFQEARRIKAFAPSLIAFLDYSPHPGFFIRALKEQYKTTLPLLVVHVFGDFALHPNEWLETEAAIQNTNIRFICASEKQQALIRSFLRGSNDLVAWIPFPVDEEKYRFSEHAPDFRKHWGCENDEWVFLYTGRLSLQKNILLLLKVFAGYLKQINPRASLWLAGPFDDLGIPYLGKRPPPGLLAFDVQRVIHESFPVASRNRIRYWGDLDSEQLVDLYHGSDCFVSFSTHNDEDFGMSPAEAVCCGRPLLLSDWGGYSSFKTISPEACLTVPVTIQKRSVAPTPVACFKAMVMASARRTSREQRLALSSAAHGFCSCRSVAQKLRACLENPGSPTFQSFSPLFGRLAAAYRLNSKAPFDSGHEYSWLYRETYAPYL